MISKIKQLNAQEWTILILFIISLFSLIATVEWVGQGEEDNAYVEHVDETNQPDRITYEWSVENK
ncbi:hypothetical protein [Salibacterium aidingense]|uniref:hypothetical protein n=1 Tax=Salibacterium aidingense TaxID=384933 RepID=UPI000413A64B|nr:hypothetical protein [Salibacterium aidingense]